MENFDPRIHTETSEMTWSQGRNATFKLFKINQNVTNKVKDCKDTEYKWKYIDRAWYQTHFHCTDWHWSSCYSSMFQWYSQHKFTSSNQRLTCWALLGQECWDQAQTASCGLDSLPSNPGSPPCFSKEHCPASFVRLVRKWRGFPLHAC